MQHKLDELKHVLRDCILQAAAEVQEREDAEDLDYAQATHIAVSGVLDNVRRDMEAIFAEEYGQELSIVLHVTCNT